MSGPEYEQTDIIPALRADDDTAVDVFGPAGRARHRRPSRRRVLPAAGVAAILAGAGIVGYATYTLGSHGPTGPGPAPSVVSEEPVAVEPPVPSSWSPSARPSRTRADRRRSRTPSPSPTTATPSSRQTPTLAVPARPPVSPTPARTASPSEAPTSSPSPSTSPTTSPSTSPKVSPS